MPSLPPIPFEPAAVRHAIGDLAANAAPFVRLGALRLMVQILGMDRPGPAFGLSDRASQQIEHAIDEVMAILKKDKVSHGETSGGDEEETGEETEPL
jgi:hypothetical protein